MDLGFSKSWRRHRDAQPAEIAPASTGLALLLAATTAWQAASPTARRIAASGCGGTERSDPVLALAHVMAPRRFEEGVATALGGSFCPAVAARLTVGQEA